MAKKKLKISTSIDLDDHLVHMHDLVDDACKQKYEAGWYHPVNHALSYNAFRTSSKRGMLSVYPQAKLSLLRRQRREEPRNVPEVPASNAEEDASDGEPEEGQDDVSYEENKEPTESNPTRSGDDGSSELGGSGDRDDPKSQFPDFVVIEKFPSKRNFAAIVVEVKPPPLELHALCEEDDKKSLVTRIMDHALSQNVQQAQFAFAEFPTQTVVHIFCMVATYFRVLTFQRSKLPEIGEYWPRTPRFRTSTTNAMFKTENGEYMDYSNSFKTWWTKAMEVQEKQEITVLVRDVVKEAVAVAAAKNAAKDAGTDSTVAENSGENTAPL